MIEDMVEIVVVKQYETNDKRYKYRYKFTKAHADEVTEEDLEDAWGDAHVDEDGLWWRFEDKPEVLVTEEKVYAHKGDSIRDAEHQSYFALSWLDEKGYVTGFDKL